MAPVLAAVLAAAWQHMTSCCRSSWLPLWSRRLRWGARCVQEGLCTLGRSCPPPCSHGLQHTALQPRPAGGVHGVDDAVLADNAVLLMCRCWMPASMWSRLSRWVNQLRDGGLQCGGRTQTAVGSCVRRIASQFAVARAHPPPTLCARLQEQRNVLALAVHAKVSRSGVSAQQAARQSTCCNAQHHKPMNAAVAAACRTEPHCPACLCIQQAALRSPAADGTDMHLVAPVAAAAT
jgi:hypothetical protein